MTTISRRAFLGTSGVGLGLGLLGGCAPAMKGDFAPKTGPRVVVIGGGWGGATAAKYVRLADPTIEVVLLEPNKEFVSCPLSNLVLSGVRTIDSLTFGYGGLRSHGVRILHEAAAAIEPDARRVRVAGGYLQDDRLIVYPSSAHARSRAPVAASGETSHVTSWTGPDSTIVTPGPCPADRLGPWETIPTETNPGR